MTIKLAGGTEQARRSIPGLLSGTLHLLNTRYDGVRTHSDLACAASDFLRCAPLLLHRGSDRGRHDIDPPDCATDGSEGMDRLLGGGLYTRDLGGDLLSGLCRLSSQLLDFGGDNSKTLTSLTRSRRLYGRVQRQQIRLSSDIPNQPHDIANSLGGLSQALNQLVSGPGLGCRRLRDRSTIGDLTAHLSHTGSQLVSAGCDRLNIGPCLIGGHGDSFGLPSAGLRRKG